MKRKAIVTAAICLVAIHPQYAVAEETDSRQLWFGVGLGSVAVLCDLLENNLISKEVVDAQLASVQEPSPDVDTVTIIEAIEELRKSGDFKGCL